MPGLRNILGNKVRGVLASFDRPNLSRRDADAFDPLERDGLVAVCHATWPTDENLLVAWEKLLKDVPTATPFLGPVWQKAMWEDTGTPPAPPRLITMHRGSELLAVIPLTLSADGTLQTPGAATSDYLDPLIDAAAESQAWPLVLDLLSDLWDRQTRELVLHNIRDDAPCRKVLSAAASQHGFTYSEQVVEHVLRAPLAATWEQYLATLRPVNAKEMSRKLLKSAEVGGKSLTIWREENQIAPMLETALRIMAARGGEKAEAVNKFLRPLLLKVAPDMMRRGQLELAILHFDDGPAAATFHIPGPQGPMFYNSGFDPAFKRWGPGGTAVAMSIRNAIEQQHATVYDMLRGKESYKYELGGVERELFKITLRRDAR